MTLSLRSFTRFRVRSLSLLLLLLGASLLAQAQSIRYVKPTATGNGSGSNWANASGNLQAMINASSSGQQVWVAAGTYKPTTTTGPASRTVSFGMKNGVSMYGGFAGNETALSARPAINQTTPSTTILSGDIGEEGNPDDNSFHVILNLLGVTNITALDGFVITGGNANEAGSPQQPRNIGGGLCNVGQSSFNNPSSGPASSPQISNCLFTANSATSGGAIYNGAGSSGVSSPTLTNCVFRENTATNGGAVYNVGGSGAAIQPTLTNCLFQANSATKSGGAVYNDGSFRKTSNPELTNCSFQDNRAAAGGAIYNNGGSDGGNSSPTLTNCSFKSNRANSGGAIDNDGYFDANNSGGAIVNDGDFDGNSSPLIRNCSFQSNSAASGGGAIFNLTGRNSNNPTGSSPKLTNCLFQSNTAPSGGAIFNFTRYEGVINLVLTNCTFRANNAGAGGVLYGFGYGNGYVSTSTLINCVLFGNGGANTFTNNSTTISATYSLFDTSVTGYSGSAGNRTVTVSPFASTSDPALFACSPAVNAGLNSATGLAGVTTDLANNPRIFGDRVDMGAYEYQAAGGLAITAPSVSTATVGVAFSQTFTASGGSGPYSYSLASGSLPTGLSLAASGTLSGTPTGVGSFSITVKATNATSCSGVSAAYVLTVRAPVSPIRYVKVGGTGSGSSWTDASGNLQSQIDFAGAEQVWVAQGTYKPTTTTDRSISFSMKNGVAIYGGFAGTETTLAQRNPTSLTTVLSGNIGNAGSNTDNTLNVFSHPRELNLNNTAVLDGFVIRDGYENDSNPYGFYGGGMYNDTSSPTVTNCSFLDNTSFLGGGMYNNGNSNPVLTNCSFRGNTAINTGGGMQNQGSSKPSLTNCSFVGNRSRFGGGMGNVNTSNPTLTNCSFVGNTATDEGGAMNNTSSSPTLINCSLLGNSSTNDGKGIYNVDSNPTLINCVLFGNGGANTFTTNSGTITVTYSLLEPAVTRYTSSSTNLFTTVSPFLSSTDARLNSCAPAINTGDNAANSTTTDLAGNARRFNNGRIDMGAYEYQAAPTVITLTAPGVNTATVGVAFSQNFTASGGTTGSPDRPYSYSLASGPLPTGLNLDNTGVLSGTPTQAGSFTITVRGQDATGCSGVSTPYGLTVNEAVSPTPTLTGLTASPGAVCVGGVATFTATVGNVTGNYTYTLTNGISTPLTGSASGSLFSQSLTATGSGPQNFTLTVSADSRSASSETTLTVNPLPAASLTNNGPLSCAQTSVTLTAGGGSSYTFTSGSGVLGTPGAVNTVVVSTPGTYSVTVASASGCVSTTSTVVTSDQTTPSVTITPSSATLNCTSPTVSLSAVGTGSVRWSTGETTPVISVSVAGSYSVTATGDNGCSSVASASVTQDNMVPVASLVSSGTLSCSVTSVTLTANPNGQSYQFSAGATQIGTSNQAVVDAAGTYSVTVVTGNGCSAVASTSVSQDNTPPTAGLTNNGPLSCTATSVTLTASGGVSYRFSNGASQIDNGNTATVTTAGIYSVTVVSSNGCTATTSTTVIGDTNVPVATLTTNASTTLTCTQTQITLFAGGGDRYVFAGPGIVSQEGSQALVNAAGVYSVTVTSSNTGCFSVTSITINQDNTVPQASLASSGMLSCAVSSVTLTASPGGLSYAFTGPGVVSQRDNQAVVNVAGVYSVTVSNTATGCTNSTSVTISQDNGLPSVSITANPGLTIAQGQSTTLTANVSGGTSPFIYGWSTGDNTPGIITSTAGLYSVTVSGANGCSATATISVTTAPVVSSPFAITGVTTLDCSPILPNRFSINFNPRYAGDNGTAITFSVNNELLPTTESGPYTLQLYSDNPRITLNAIQSGVSSSFVYDWLAACKSSTAPNTPPRLAMSIPSQTVTQGNYFSYVIPDGTFTDTETPGSLKLSAAGVPAGLSFMGATLSGTPSTTVGSPVSITITATDPGGLSASTPLVLTVQPATGTPPPTMPFAITGVTTIQCTPVANRINISFAPRYAGMNGQPIAFEVVNELAPTTDPAPYSLTLYRDNPTITLRATQTGSPGPVTFSYNWLAACSSAGQENTPPRLNEPVASQRAVVGQGYSLNLSNTFTDQETPGQISLSAVVLPAGLALSGTMISGTPSMSGVSRVTLTATDGGGLSTSTTFSITVNPASGTPTPPPSAAFSLTGVTTVSCEVVSVGQRKVTFTPRYAGNNGTPINFSVVNELAPTTQPGPYSLNLYLDNPTIVLSAVQSRVSSQFRYEWLAACTANARQGAAAEVPLSVTVLGNPALGSQLNVEVRGAGGQPLYLQLTNASGGQVNEQRVGQAATVERQTLELGHQPAGVLLLRVSTPTQTRTVKVVKGE